MVMELIQGVTLKKYVKNFKKNSLLPTMMQKNRNSPMKNEHLSEDSCNGALSESECRIIMKQLLETIRYLHSKEVSVCHR